MASDQTAKPSQNPAAGDSGLGAALAEILGKYQQTVDGLLPAKVVDYDRKRNVATVKPLIMMKSTDGERLSRAQYAEVPCLALGGGGFFVNFPLRRDDLGWIAASDRDISLFMQSLEEEAPNTNRICKFSDGIFVPDVFRQYVIDGEDSANMVISSVDSVIRISLGDGKVKITAPAVVIDTPTTTVTGKLKVNGDTTLDAKLAVAGAATMTAGLTINGIPFGTHRHMEQGDGSPTGVPII